MENIIKFLKRRKTWLGLLVMVFGVFIINFIVTKQLEFPIWGYGVFIGGLIGDYFQFKNIGKAKMQSKS